MASSAITPPQYACRLGIKPDKVLAWIRSGELRAINVATNAHGRPRWRIPAEAILAFESARTSRPTAKSPRQRKRTDVINFF